MLVLGGKYLVAEALREKTVQKAETWRNCVTMATYLAVLQERDRVFIVRRMGLHECDGVAGGTVQEFRSTQCEVCGDNVVKRFALDLDKWPDMAAPIPAVIIGGKEAEA